MFIHTSTDIQNQRHVTKNVSRVIAVNHFHLSAVGEGRKVKEMQYWFAPPSHPWEGWLWNTTECMAANITARAGELLNVQDKRWVTQVQARVERVAYRSTNVAVERHQFSFWFRRLISWMKLSLFSPHPQLKWSECDLKYVYITTTSYHILPDTSLTTLHPCDAVTHMQLKSSVKWTTNETNVTATHTGAPKIKNSFTLLLLYYTLFT
jgi:hypothetical protein